MWDFKPLLMAGAVVLPLQDQENWQLLEYGGIPANQVEFREAGMLVSVNQSAGPIVYPLEQSMRVSRISVSGELKNLLNVRPGSQGLADEDDFSLKVGLVIAGDKRLNFIQRMVSADWVKTLYGLAPEDAGIDRIVFLNAVQYETQLGQRRQHPLSDLIHERNVWLLDRSGPFELNYELAVAHDVLAVWLSIDGDDSRSNYSTLISNLTLEGPRTTASMKKSIIR